MIFWFMQCLYIQKFVLKKKNQIYKDIVCTKNNKRKDIKYCYGQYGVDLCKHSCFEIYHTILYL